MDRTLQPKVKVANAKALPPRFLVKIFDQLIKQELAAAGSANSPWRSM